jgi:DNA repair protein RadC
MLIEIKEEIQQVSDAESVAEIFRSILLTESEVDQDREHFWVIGLNTQNFVLYVELVSIGTLTNSLVSPRETFRMALMKAAAQIIVGHNHPGGNLQASSEDKFITERLEQAGEILGIKLCDHIIIGNNNPGCFSFHRQGLLGEKGKLEMAAGSEQIVKENIFRQLEFQRNDIVCDILDLKALAELSMHAAIYSEECKKISWISVINFFNRGLDSVEGKLTKMDRLLFTACPQK